MPVMHLDVFLPKLRINREDDWFHWFWLPPPRPLSAILAMAWKCVDFLTFRSVGGDEVANGIWTRRETLAALALYLNPPDGRKNWDKTDDKILRLARLLGRTPAAICFKAANFKSCDPNRVGAGFSHHSRLDQDVMFEYANDPDGILDESFDALSSYGMSFSLKEENQKVSDSSSGTGLSIEYDALSDSHTPLGGDVIRLAKQRVNHEYFRRNLFAIYKGRCCLTGVSLKPMLVASHIKPWKVSTSVEKTASSNGILLNAFHDKAFDKGLITIDRDYCIRVSPTVPHSEAHDRWLYSYEGQRIELPDDSSRVTWPGADFIDYHNDVIFLAS